MTKLIDITGKAKSGEWGTDDDIGNGIPVLRTTNFTYTGKINFNDVITRIIKKKNIEDKYLRKGDIIIEKSGGSDKFPVGRVIYFDGEENKYLFNNFTGLLRIQDKEKWYPKYVLYSLLANYNRGGTRRFENKTTGLHNLKIDDYVKKFDVKDIEYANQVNISIQLDKLDKIICKYNEEIKMLDDLIKARFVEMFGDIHNSKLYPYVNIDSITTVLSGGTPDRKVEEYWDNGSIRWVKTTELQNCVITDTEERITQAGMDNSSAKIVPIGSVLIAMYGQGKTRGMTGYLAVECTTNQACACILPTKKINQIFLWKYMILSYDKLRNMAKGGNQPNLNIGLIKKFPILFPPIELQNEFADFVRQIDKSKFMDEMMVYKLKM